MLCGYWLDFSEYTLNQHAPALAGMVGTIGADSQYDSVEAVFGEDGAGVFIVVRKVSAVSFVRVAGGAFGGFCEGLS